MKLTELEKATILANRFRAEQISARVSRGRSRRPISKSEGWLLARHMDSCSGCETCRPSRSHADKVSGI